MTTLKTAPARGHDERRRRVQQTAQHQWRRTTNMLAPRAGGAGDGRLSHRAVGAHRSGSASGQSEGARAQSQQECQPHAADAGPRCASRCAGRLLNRRKSAVVA